MIFISEIRSFLFRQSLNTLFFIPVLLFSCTGKRAVTGESLKMDDKPIISYAKRFKIEKMEGYSQLSFIDTSQVIEVPVKKIICMSTTHLAMISALNETGSVSGFSGTRFLFSDDLLQNVGKGNIREIGYEDNLNKELILKLDPDLVMVYGIDSESAGYIGKLKELGIKILYNADYLETDPLGKAEWIKFVGALYSKEHMADSIFRTIEN
jgi:ABC-type Fe3+-hydroxamate transport system substrate-binding protein